jgi:hypothetical protein
MLCGLGPALSAQKLAEVDVGQRVRVYAALTSDDRHGWIEGLLVGIDSNSLELQPIGGRPVVVPQEGLRSLEEFAGRRSHTALGLLIGAIGGTLLGGMTGTVARGECPENASGTSTGGSVTEFCGTRAVLTLTAGGLVSGGVIGAIIGTLVKKNRWRSVPFDRYWLRLDPPDSRLWFGLSLTT